MKDLKQLIRESINDYIREIDTAGDMAAYTAKEEATQKAIDERTKMLNMEGIDEVYHKMLDKNKMKELSSEIKALEKSLVKLKKQKEKLTSKANKGEKVESTEEKEIVDEISLRENDNEETDFEDLMDAVDDYFEPNTPEHKKLMDAVENALNNGEIDTMDFSHSPSAPSKAVERIAKEMGMDESLNESFLYMQKLAGLITEGQYQAKKKVLNEGEYSDWWAKADDELGLDFGDDIYSYVDSYDEPWQGKFADEVVNIDADDYEDFKNQVKQLYDEINPF